MLRVDHVERYRLPKHVQEREGNEMMMTETEGDEKKRNKNSVAEAGHAYEGQELATSYDIHSGQDLFAAPKIERDNDHNNQREGATTHGTEKNPVDNDKAERKRRKEKSIDGGRRSERGGSMVVLVVEVVVRTSDDTHALDPVQNNELVIGKIIIKFLSTSSSYYFLILLLLQQLLPPLPNTSATPQRTNDPSAYPTPHVSALQINPSNAPHTHNRQL
jgi:hypothetical protein